VEDCDDLPDYIPPAAAREAAMSDEPTLAQVIERLDGMRAELMERLDRLQEQMAELARLIHRVGR
jgi:hypothetical protein